MKAPCMSIAAAPVEVALFDLADATALAPAGAPSPRDLADAPPREPSRTLFLARRATARMLAARRLGRPPSDIDIARDAHGAPRILAPDGARPPHISLAARANICAIALGDARVGVDLEPIDEPFEPPMNVLHPAERARIAASADPHEAFLRVWTAKEAWLKACGTGLAREPARIEIRPVGAQGFAVRDAAATAEPAFARSVVVAFGGRRVALAWAALA